MSEQIDFLDQARANRDEAIRKAEIGQELQSYGWGDVAMSYLIDYVLSTEGPFLADTFRSWAEDKGLQKPKEPRAYGPVFMKASKRNIINKTGQYEEVRSPGSHLRPMPLWERAQ